MSIVKEYVIINVILETLPGYIELQPRIQQS